MSEPARRLRRALPLLLPALLTANAAPSAAAALSPAAAPARAEAPAETAAPGPAPGTLTLAFDQAKSDLGFTIHRPGETIEGRAHQFAGEVLVDPAYPGNDPSVVLRVQASSLETGNRVRDHTMRNSHLEAERFPEIVFRSTSIRLSDGSGRGGTGADGSDAAGPAAPGPAAPGPLRPGEPRTAIVEGTLGLHGVTRDVLFPATIRYDNGSLSAEGELNLRLSDHAIPIPRFLWIVLDDEVKIHFRFVAAPPPKGMGAG